MKISKILILSALLLVIPSIASAATLINGLYYNLNSSSKTAEVTYYKYNSDDNQDYVNGKVSIPSTVNYGGTNYRVTAIGKCAFYQCSSLTEIIIPEEVTKFDNYAFQGCSQLTSVNIPKGVTTIPSGCFWGCRSLTEIKLPEGVTSIGDSAFKSCFKLTSINIPKGVKKISSECFFQCTSLIEIELPEGLNSIENGAFEFCEQLASINIPDGVKEIPRYCFSRCTSLTEIKLPERLTSIGVSAFYNCSMLKTINIPDGITLIDNNTFYGCSQLSSIIIPNSVEKILISCFEDCTSLKQLILPANVNEIGKWAFVGCSKLTELTCLNPEPANCDESSVFPDKLMNNGVLYVPDESVEAYKAANVWKEFKNIKPKSTVRIKVDDFDMQVGEDASVNIGIVSPGGSFEYAGFQFDMQVPEGLTVSDIKLADALTQAGFQMTSKTSSGNKTRIITYSLRGQNVSQLDDIISFTLTASADIQPGEYQIDFTNITFTAADGSEYTFDDSQVTVTFKNVPVSSITITPEDTQSIYVDGQCTFTATVSPDNATVKDVEWSLAEGDGIVEITDNGNNTVSVKGIAIGDATLTAKAKDNSNVTANATVHVIATPAQSVTISSEGDIHVMKETETLQLTATVLPAETSNKDVIWSSSSDANATVSTDGVVTAVKEGEVTITAIVKDTPNVQNTYTITIEPRLLGDANDNGMVNVADVVTIASKIVDTPVQTFCFVNADVNENKQIEIGDVTGTVQIIIDELDEDDDSAIRSLRRSGLHDTSDRLVTADFHASDKNLNIGVGLDNTIEYVALQASIRVPEGMTVTEITAGPRATDHQLIYNIKDDGSVKVVMFSFNNMPFAAGDGSLFNIHATAVSDCGDIRISNILTSDADNNEYTLGNAGGRNLAGMTGIDSTGVQTVTINTFRGGIEVLNAFGNEVAVYTANGALIALIDNASDAERISLESGIYIVRVGQTTAKLVVR